jgi:hypothetical protein
MLAGREEPADVDSVDKPAVIDFVERIAQKSSP